MTPTNLRIYQASIKDFKPAVQNENYLPSTNFYIILSRTLYFGIPSFGISPKIQPAKTHDRELLDLTHFGKNQPTLRDSLMALLILEMGLLPVRSSKSRSKIFSWTFMSFEWAKMAKTVLKVPEPLLDELQLFLDGIYLFDNKRKISTPVSGDSDN